MNVASEELNIWSDPSAAAFVRSVNGGNETVPTVLVGATTMLNPRPRQVRREIKRQSPSLDVN
jgi:mycoredoxin